MKKEELAPEPLACCLKEMRLYNEEFGNIDEEYFTCRVCGLVLKMKE